MIKTVIIRGLDNKPDLLDKLNRLKEIQGVNTYSKVFERVVDDFFVCDEQRSDLQEKVSQLEKENESLKHTIRLISK